MWEKIGQGVLGVAVPWGLMACGIFFCGYLGLFFVRRPRRMLASFGKQERGGVSPFRALMLALGGTLGVGNIVGVSSAIVLGGAGAVLWMWVSALCAMVLKYAEIVLSMRHRRFDGQGRPYGGAPYYIRDILDRRGLTCLGAFLGGLFALLLLLNALSMGSLLQSEAITGALDGVLGIPPMLTGTALALAVFFVMRGGAERILRMTERLVPWMTLGYVILSLGVLCVRWESVPAAVGRIFSEAAEPCAAAGGVGGFLLSRGVRYGTMRGLISNEAGCGTSPTAHALSDGNQAARQGVWGMLEVFVDTILLCTLTAIVVLLGHDASAAESGNFIMVTLSAYAFVFGDFASVAMSVFVLCFGFATILCWAHYGRESVRCLCQGKGGERAFGYLYAATVALGACSLSDAVWTLTDWCVGLMTMINLIVLLLAKREIRAETREYFFKERK